jgi:hypothetical protein
MGQLTSIKILMTYEHPAGSTWAPSAQMLVEYWRGGSILAVAKRLSHYSEMLDVRVNKVQDTSSILTFHSRNSDAFSSV